MMMTMMLLLLSSMSTAFGWTINLLPQAAPSKNYYKTASSYLSASSSNEEQDLFDYFDPLKSPHEYPNGIGNRKGADSNDATDTGSNAKPYSMNVFGMDSAKPLEVVEDDSKAPSEETVVATESDDLFDYFDPLKSPHEYPNGVDNEVRNPPAKADEGRYDPLDLRKKREAIENSSIRNSNGSTTTDAPPSGGNKVGILLMDHGSRNKASNQRLQYMAELYQQMAIMEQNAAPSDESSTVIVVKAAHMEIATPSIPDQLEALMKEGVDEIICHPYFLSPAGRHVAEDIPEIIEQAISDLRIDIPIITTDPLGANTQLMIGAIHSSIRENSNILSTQRPNN